MIDREEMEKALGNIFYPVFGGAIEYCNIEKFKAEMRDGINTYGEMGISVSFYENNMTKDELKELKEFYKGLVWDDEYEDEEQELEEPEEDEREDSCSRCRKEEHLFREKVDKIKLLIGKKMSLYELDTKIQKIMGYSVVSIENSNGPESIFYDGNKRGKFEYGWLPCSYSIEFDVKKYYDVKCKDTEWFEKQDKCFKKSIVILRNIKYCKKFDE